MYLLYSVNVYIFNVVIEIKFYSILFYSILFYDQLCTRLLSALQNNPFSHIKDVSPGKHINIYMTIAHQMIVKSELFKMLMYDLCTAKSQLYSN